jgi:hypothetical protein
MRQKTGLKLEQKITERQELDMIDMQSVCGGAHVKAEELVKKHNGNIKEIEREILEMDIPEAIAGHEGFNYRDEVWWAVKWLLSMTYGLMVEGKNPILLHFQRTLNESSHVLIK